MTGICGLTDWRGGPADEDLVVQMWQAMAGRVAGRPGVHAEEGLTTACGEAATVESDASTRSTIPLEGPGLRLLLDGQIYNTSQLRRELRPNQRDGGTLLSGYRQWGIESLLTRLRGKFALAIWDGRRRQVHLARDRIGQKPLFYHFADGRLIFASDIKAVWHALDRPANVDERAMDEFLYYRAISQHRTIFRGVHRVQPGGYVTFGDGQATARCYWRPDYTRKLSRPVSEWIEGVDHHLRQAVRRCLTDLADPGVFLSGGVDSSAVAALTAQECQGRVRTFSVGFLGASGYDERDHAAAVARHIGSEHVPLTVRHDDVPRLSEIVWHCGEPFGDSSILAADVIAREARRRVEIALTGDAGDAAFAGHHRQIRPAEVRRYAWLTPLVTHGVLPLTAWLLGWLAPRSTHSRSVARAAGYVSGDPDAIAGDSCWYDGLRRSLYSDGLLRRLAGYHPLRAQRRMLRSLRGRTPIDRGMEYHLRVEFPNGVLVKLEKATTAHGLRVRSPFLDADLLEFAMTIPSDVLVAGRVPKALLKRYVARLVPREVVYRRKKGFAVPVRHWLAERWAGPVRELLLSKTAAGRGYFNPRCVRWILDEHARTRRHGSRIWTLVVLEVWHRLFVDHTLAPGEPVLGV